MKNIIYAAIFTVSLTTFGQSIDTTITLQTDTFDESGITSIHHENNNNIILSWATNQHNDSLLYASTITNLGERIRHSILMESAMPSSVIYKKSAGDFVVFASGTDNGTSQIQVFSLSPDSYNPKYSFDVDDQYLLKDMERVGGQTYILANNVSTEQMALIQFNSGDSLLSVQDITAETEEHNAVSIHVRDPEEVNGFHILGNTADRICMLQTNLNGNINWIRYYSNDNVLQASSWVRFKEDYIISGYSEGFGQNNASVFLYQVDGSGNTVWSTTIEDAGDNSRANDLQLDGDTALIIAGAKTTTSGDHNSFILKTDTLGNETGYWVIENDTEENALLSLEPSASGAYLAIGDKLVNDNKNLLISYFGYSSVTAIPATFTSDMRIYPNPTTDKVRIKGLKHITRAEIYSVSGELLHVKHFQRADTYEISVGKLSSGLYIVVVHTQDNSYQSKVLKR